MDGSQDQPNTDSNAPGQSGYYMFNPVVLQKALDATLETNAQSGVQHVLVF